MPNEVHTVEVILTHDHSIHDAEAVARAQAQEKLAPGESVVNFSFVRAHDAGKITENKKKFVFSYQVLGGPGDSVAAPAYG